MQLTIEPYREKDLEGVRKIWNEITQQGNAFPGEALYSSEGMKEFSLWTDPGSPAQSRGKP